MTAYELGKRAGDRGIAEMIKTLPESRQKSIVQNDAVAAAFEAGKARAEKLSKDAAKTKKPVRLKIRSLSRAKKNESVLKTNADVIEIDGELVVELNLQSDIQQALTEASPKERGKIVEKILKVSIRHDGEYEFHDGTTATMDNGDISKIGHSKNEIKNRASVSMGDIVKVAILVDNAENVEHPKFSAFKYYKAKVKIGAELYECVVNVGFGKFDKAYHIYDINQFEIVSENKNRSGSPIQSNPRKSVEQTVSRTTTSTDSISEKGEKVNTSDEKNSVKGEKSRKKKSLGKGVYRGCS